MPFLKSAAASSFSMHVMAKPHRMITAIRLETQLSLICGALIGQEWERGVSGVRAARGGRLAAARRTSGKVSVHLRATAHVCSATLLGSAGSGAPPR